MVYIIAVYLFTIFIYIHIIYLAVNCSRGLHYRKIWNTICTPVQYAPQTFTGKPWENVSLAVQYAPVLCQFYSAR